MIWAVSWTNASIAQMHNLKFTENGSYTMQTDENFCYHENAMLLLWNPK